MISVIFVIIGGVCFIAIMILGLFQGKKETGKPSRNYDELLEAARKAMLEKLKENAHKPGFDYINFNFAVNRTEEELGELKQAFQKCKNADLNYRMGLTSDIYILINALKEMRREAADCANFPAMIILKCDKMIAELEAGQ